MSTGTTTMQTDVTGYPALIIISPIVYEHSYANGTATVFSDGLFLLLRGPIGYLTCLAFDVACTVCFHGTTQT